MKTCRDCGISKPRSQYDKNSASADGYVNICKTCKKYKRDQKVGLEGENNRLMKSWGRL